MSCKTRYRGKGRDPGMQQQVNGDGSAISDTCGDRDLADQIKPAGIPSPGRPTTPPKTKLGGPVIEASGGRECRGQFSHAQSNNDHEDSDERPANRGGRIADCRRNQVKEGDTPTKDRDDGERDREVGEAAHRTEQFLRIAETMQAFNVLVDEFFTFA